MNRPSSAVAVSREPASLQQLKTLAALVRYYSLAASTRAGSGHPTSSLSAADLMTALFFGGVFRFDLDDPSHPNNDRLIFSKGHASPLFYSLWLAAGRVSEVEIMTYRKFESALEGHPTPAFRYAEAATGSLGQGLSIGVGLAINAKELDRLPYRTYVLLGDSEMAEGSQWEAIQIAAHRKLDNLVAVLDVNRLGQRGPTMLGHDVQAYKRRVGAFGWETIVIDGHSLPKILDAFAKAAAVQARPTMIIARTIKGKGVSFLEDQEGWHGKALNAEEFERAKKEIGPIDLSARGTVLKPADLRPEPSAPPGPAGPIEYSSDRPVATRDAYGHALVRIFPRFPAIVSLDGEVSNSTKAETFAHAHPDRYLEMYIAEQNMVGVALGLSLRGKLPFVSTFAAFFSRAFDQIRMSQYSNGNIKFVGSHAGVAIGEDGPSQMGLEDIAMFRAVRESVVLHPSDAVSTERLVELAAEYRGLVYLRTLRQAVPILYSANAPFSIGGCAVLRESPRDIAVLVAAGTTLHEALAAAETLGRENIAVRVIDLYSIKPVDAVTLEGAARATGLVLTIEDHYPEGGLGEAVRAALGMVPIPVVSLAVRRRPKSGKPFELLDFEEISERAIVRTVKERLERQTTS